MAYFAAGMNATAALLNNAPGVRPARKTTNLIRNNNAALFTDTELTISVPANTVWALVSNLFYAAATAADAAFNLSVPSGATYQISSMGLQTAAAAAADTINMSVSSSTSVTAGGLGVSISLVAPLRGTVVIAATAGSIAIRFAQLTANASDATLYAGSWMMLTQLA